MRWIELAMVAACAAAGCTDSCPPEAVPIAWRIAAPFGVQMAGTADGSLVMLVDLDKPVQLADETIDAPTLARVAPTGKITTATIPSHAMVNEWVSVGADGAAALVLDTTTIASYDATFALAWQHTFPQFALIDGASAGASGRVAYGASAVADQPMLVLADATGAPIWSVPNTFGDYPYILASGDVVVVQDVQDAVHAYHLAAADGSLVGMSTIMHCAECGLYGPLGDGSFVLRDETSGLTRFDLGGTQTWQQPIVGVAYVMASVDGTMLVATTGDGGVYRIDNATGAIVDHRANCRAIGAPLAVDATGYVVEETRLDMAVSTMTISIARFLW